MSQELQIIDLVEGEGKAAVKGALITTQYTGWLADGRPAARLTMPPFLENLALSEGLPCGCDKGGHGKPRAAAPAPSLFPCRSLGGPRWGLCALCRCFGWRVGSDFCEASWWGLAWRRWPPTCSSGRPT